jgi:hypothetical protein
MRTRKRRIDWNQYTHLLGAMSDAQAAARIGCTSAAVCAARKTLGVPPCQRPTIDWATHTRLLGTMADCDLAQRIGCATTTTAVRKARAARGIAPFRNVGIDWEKWSDLLHSSLTNAAVAAQIGCATRTVRVRRRRLGIRPGMDWDAHAHVLGTMSDRALAAKLNCARTTVGQQRRKRGILPYEP